jgi:DNA-binding transcriptional ArsR family regulator
LRAVSHPLRREILRALKSGSATFEDLQSQTGLDTDALKWHLGILEHDFCIERAFEQGKQVFKLTKEGRVVEYLE